MSDAPSHRPRLAVVNTHACQPILACAHGSDWTCPDCGQRWIKAGDRAWVNGDWLTYVRIIAREAS